MTTNYKKLTDMMIRELAIFLADVINCKYCPIKDCQDFCNREIEQWLESESED